MAFTYQFAFEHVHSLPDSPKRYVASFALTFDLGYAVVQTAEIFLKIDRFDHLATKKRNIFVEIIHSRVQPRLVLGITE